jgi:hypothetical protein
MGQPFGREVDDHQRNGRHVGGVMTLRQSLYRGEVRDLVPVLNYFTASLTLHMENDSAIHSILLFLIIIYYIIKIQVIVPPRV